MLTRAAPSPVQTKAAMKFLLASDNAQLDYQMQQASDLGKYISMGGDPSKFEGWYTNKFPMTDKLKQVQLQVGSIASNKLITHPQYPGFSIQQ